MSTRVHLIAPRLGDMVMNLSTLPALAVALRAAGADVVVHGRWDFTWDRDDLSAPVHRSTTDRLRRVLVRLVPGSTDPWAQYAPPDDAWGHPLHAHETPERVARLTEALWAGVDLTGADLVVAPGWHVTQRVWAHPTRPPSARVVALDFHMLDGAKAWAASRTPAGVEPGRAPWWPGPELSVLACFPGYRHLYDSHGVPADAVTWVPYPLHVPHFRDPRPSTSGAAIFAGGRHHRDFDTLVAAARLLPHLRHPIVVHGPSSDVGQVAPPLLALGEVPLVPFVGRLRDARFVVVPLHRDVNTAAGLTVIAMAHAAGRPVIATRTAATEPVIRDGVDGLLVPVGDAAALATAIDRLDGDAGLLERLSAGAREAGDAADPTRLARRVLGA